MRSDASRGGSYKHICEGSASGQFNNPQHDMDIGFAQTALANAFACMTRRRMEGTLPRQIVQAYQTIKGITKQVSRSSFKTMSICQREVVMKWLSDEEVKRIEGRTQRSLPTMVLPKRPPTRINQGDDE